MLSRALPESRQIYPLLALVLGTLLLVVGLIVSTANWFWLFLLALALLFCCFSLGRALLRLLPALVPCALFVFGIALLAGTPEKALQNSLRTFLFGLSALLTLSVEPVRLVRNLNQLRVPRALTLALLIVLRFVAVMRVELRRIRTAMRTRGAAASLWRPQVLYRALIVPLVGRLFSISDLLSDSLEVRAFSLEAPYESYKQVRPRLRDALLGASLSLLMVGALYLFGSGVRLP